MSPSWHLKQIINISHSQHTSPNHPHTEHFHDLHYLLKLLLLLAYKRAMSRHVLGMGLLAVTVTAQANLASSGFEYVGCVEADPQLFGLNIDFFQPFTPQECQAACAGKASYAALGGGCRCDVPSQAPEVTFKILDEAACSVLCIPDNPDAGRCGGSGEGDQVGFQLFSLYKKAGEDSGAEGPGEVMDDCHEGDAAALNKAAEAPVIVETIYSCPPEKEDCPLRAANKLPVPVSCPPEGCQPSPVPTPIPAPSATPVPEPPCPPEGCAPVFNKVPVPCPAEGCRPCPPEGCPPCADGQCLPACPEGCVAPPPPEVAPTPTPSPVCPGGCNGPTTLMPASVVPTTAPIDAPPSPPEPKPEVSDLPVSVSEARQGRATTIEMLTIMGAAIVLLAF